MLQTLEDLQEYLIYLISDILLLRKNTILRKQTAEVGQLW